MAEAKPDRTDASSEGFSRREFVVAAGGTVAACTMLPLIGCEPGARQSSPPPGPIPAGSPTEPQDFFARYRAKWSWDHVVRGTHFNNCAYQTNCAFNVFVKDGHVVREEQIADYPQTNQDVPDLNPRGCQKGCAYSSFMYSEPRLTRPLRRKGERGSGAWEEVSWDEALTDIADKLIDAITEDGPESVVMDLGTNIEGMTTFLSCLRLADALDCVMLDMNAEIGDHQPGAAVTYGEMTIGRSTDDFFYSDLILIWGGNPIYTHIPNFHMLTEARYRGAQLVSISPDMNASAIRTDLWIPVRPGTDAALALSLAKVIIDEGWYDADLVREQTDLPFLVRLDNGRLLRESDLEPDGSGEQLYRWDLARGELEAASTESLALRGCVPALEGTFEVETLGGLVQVQPVFERLKAKLAAFSPEEASRHCGTPPALIRRLARMLAEAKAATNVETTVFGKLYHGSAVMRAQILVFVLCGHLGRKGAGFISYTNVGPDGHYSLLKDSQILREIRWDLVKQHAPQLARDWVTGKDMSRSVRRAISDSWVDAKIFASATLFWHVHGGILEESAKAQDTYLKREVSDYVREAVEKEWQLLEPAPSKRPRVLLSMAGNLLRRVRGSHRLREVLWPKLDLVVVLDVRMSSTARFADYVLPAAGFYEKPNSAAFMSGQALFVHAGEKAVEAIGEAKDEWEIVCRLAKKVQERARARGIETFVSRRGKQRRLDRVYDAITRGGEFREQHAEKLSQVVIENSSNLGDTSWQKLKKKGFTRATGLGKSLWNSSATDWEPNQTMTPFLWHTRDKAPWSTLSGRVQFYIDHDWYLELGEELPTFKDPLKAGGDHPLVMSGGHTRWSIHALQRSDPLMLRLQRGGPCMYVSLADARERGIEDGDKIEVFNDIGRFLVKAKLSPAVRPGQVIIYHAWEDYQFEGGIGYRNVVASPINPLELAGGHPFMAPSFAMRHPGMNDRDTRVEIRKVRRSERRPA
jgi:DMSO reductase family type II enzyme molybdopterin subunit